MSGCLPGLPMQVTFLLSHQSSNQQVHCGGGRRMGARAINRGGLWSVPGVGLATLAICLGLGAGDVSASRKPSTLPPAIQYIEVRAEPLASFDRVLAGRQRFGQLEWIGGLRLTSDDKFFGGLSGIALDGDGKGFVMVSDAGLWMTGNLAYRDGRPIAIEDVRIGPLKALDDSVLRRDRDRDAEAVVLVRGSTQRGELLISFEQNHRIGRFNIGPDGVSAPKSYIRPDLSRGRIPTQKGFEALTVLKVGRYKGAVVAISERKLDAQGRHTGWLWSKGKPHVFTLTDIDGFDITDLAVLPDGDLVVLERRFRWTEGVKMRIRRIALRDLVPGAALSGHVLMEATMAQNIDNMEGLGVHQDATGATIITLVSDDNYNRALQKTLLLQFRLIDKAEKTTAR